MEAAIEQPKYSLKTLLIVAGVTAVVVLLLTLGLTCSSGSSSEPAAKPTPSQAPTGPMAAVHDSVFLRGHPYYRVETNDTGRVDTLILTVEGPCYASAGDPPKPGFQISKLFGAAAPLIAAFRPATPRNFFEVYVKAGMAMLDGYGGAVTAQVNLDQLHLVNASVYAEVGLYAKMGFYFVVGVMGKIWGWL